MAKFHEKALALYAVPQLSEGNGAIKPTFVLTGTATITTGSPTITGVGSKYITELAAGDTITNVAGVVVGTIFSITSNTVATLTANGAVAVTAASIINSKTAGTITAGTGSATVTGSGTAFLLEAAPGAYIKDTAGNIAGQILTVASDTSLTLTANSLIALTAAKYSVGMGPLNAIAVTEFNYSDEIDTEAFQYLGDELNRDEDTSIKDIYCKLDFQVFNPALGTIAGADPVASEAPVSPLFLASGMALVLSTGGQGFVKYTNSLVSNVFLSLEVRKSSPDLATTQKVYAISDARGNIDLDAVVGSRAKLKFNFQGNLDFIRQQLKVTENFLNQKVYHAPSMSSKNISVSELDLYVGSTEPTATNVKNFCFEKVNAPNVSGFAYNRYLNSCNDGWSKGATPTDMTISILEDSADATYNPHQHLTENHLITLKYGSLVGYKSEIIAHKAQLAKITGGTIGDYKSQDLLFRNVGYTDFIFR